jgi:hypothetical protein
LQATNTVALAFGGSTGSDTGATEEWNVVTRGAWATGGSLNTARQGLAGAGTQNAGLAFGGGPPTGVEKQ